MRGMQMPLLRMERPEQGRWPPAWGPEEPCQLSLWAMLGGVGWNSIGLGNVIGFWDGQGCGFSVGALAGARGETGTCETKALEELANSTGDAGVP